MRCPGVRTPNPCISVRRVIILTRITGVHRSVISTGRRITLIPTSRSASSTADAGARDAARPMAIGVMAAGRRLVTAGHHLAMVDHLLGMAVVTIDAGPT